MEFETNASTHSLLDMALDPSVLTIVLLLIITTLWRFVKTLDKRDYPPGPCGLPFIGNLHQVGKMPFITFVEMSKRYGHVFSLHMGKRYTVILNSFDSVNEAFVNQSDIFNDRPPEYNLNMVDTGKNSIAYENGPIWKEHRRLLANTLKHIGVGTTEFENKIMIEIQTLVAEIRKKKIDAPMDIAKDIAKGFTHIANLIVLGKSLNYNHPIYEAFERFQSQFLQGSSMYLHLFLPWVKHIPGFMMISGQNRLNQCGLELNRTLTKELENNDNYVEGYAQAYLDKQRSSSNNEIYTMDGLSSNFQLLYIASVETCNTTIQWALTYMMAYPDVQKKVQEELDLVMGQERVPTFKDRVRTPYTEATLLEVLRMAPVAPLNMAHSNNVTSRIANYIIPKDSCVIANIWAINYDPVRWGDPENFRPQRFLDEEGRLIKSNQIVTFSIESPVVFLAGMLYRKDIPTGRMLCPFSSSTGHYGKRNCLGEPLAKMELYLYFTSLLKNFTFEKPYKDQPFVFTATYDISFRPANFKVWIKERL